MMNLSHKIVLAIFRPLLKVLVSWEVRGKENVPLTGPLVVISNHVHLIDPILLMFSFPRWINFMAKEELFRYTFLRFVIRWAQAFPVRRRGTVNDKRRAFKQAKDMLEMGLALGMFPEGGRSPGAKLLPGKFGSVVISLHTDALLLPVGIAGTEKLKGISWLWRRPHIVINIGEPFKLCHSDGRLTKPQMKLLTDSAMKKIAGLLPPDYRGVYR
jgi:1-acyl-sn-glycerol-3-phosphate acyltransferase